MKQSSRHKKWLESLQVNDHVLLWGRIGEVTRITDTMFIIKTLGTARDKVLRTTGMLMPHNPTWPVPMLEPTTARLAALKEPRERAKMIGELRTFNWSKCSTRALNKIYELLPRCR